MELRDYQRELIKQFITIPGNILLHGDMRIGKSGITSSYFQDFWHSGAIFAMPVSPLYQFKGDAIAFGVPEDQIVILNDEPDKFEALEAALIARKLVLVSHKTLANLYYEYQSPLETVLKKLKPLLVIDEADEIGFKNEYKNKKSKTNMARAYRKLVKCSGKTIMMSGTVLQANSCEYLYFYYALNLSDRRSVRPIIHEHFNIGLDNNGREIVLNPKNEEDYKEFLKQFMIRVKLTDVVDYIPDYTVEKIEIPDPALEDVFEEVRTTFLLPTTDVDKRYIKTEMDISRKLMRLAVYPNEYGIDYVSAKEKILLEILRTNNEKNIIIFSVNKEFIEYFGQRYNIDYIVGSVKVKDRAKFVENFQGNTGSRIIINIASGAHGLTLDTADIMVFVDLPYSMTKFKQALARLIPRAEHMVKDQQILILHNDLVDYRVEEILKQKETATKLGYEWEE